MKRFQIAIKENVAISEQVRKHSRLCQKNIYIFIIGICRNVRKLVNTIVVL